MGDLCSNTVTCHKRKNNSGYPPHSSFNATGPKTLLESHSSKKYSLIWCYSGDEEEMKFLSDGHFYPSAVKGCCHWASRHVTWTPKFLNATTQ